MDVKLSKLESTKYLCNSTINEVHYDWNGRIWPCQCCFRLQNTNDFYSCSAGNKCKYYEITGSTFSICNDCFNYLSKFILNHDTLYQKIIKQINHLS